MNKFKKQVEILEEAQHVFLKLSPWTKNLSELQMDINYILDKVEQCNPKNSYE